MPRDISWLNFWPRSVPSVAVHHSSQASLDIALEKCVHHWINGRIYNVEQRQYRPICEGIRFRWIKSGDQWVHCYNGFTKITKSKHCNRTTDTFHRRGSPIVRRHFWAGLSLSIESHLPHLYFHSSLLASNDHGNSTGQIRQRKHWQNLENDKIEKIECSKWTRWIARWRGEVE